MKAKLLRAISDRLPCRQIDINGRPYLRRYYVGKLFGVTINLHEFVSCDGERHLHNHPWRWGRALVLSGGYIEEAVTDLCTRTPNGCVTEYRRVRWWNKIDGNHFHRIAAVKRGTWTLFMRSDRQVIRAGQASIEKGWGFLSRQGTATEFTAAPSSPEDWWKTAPKGWQVARY